MLEWLRLPGDVVFIGGGVLPLLWLSFLALRGRGKGAAASVGTPPIPPTRESEELMLFTEVEDPHPAESSAAGALRG